MSGRAAVAPCGHPGEVVIGTYVKCLQGCDVPKSAAQVARPKCRPGEPGHVPDCACKLCQVRRSAVAFKFRTRDGKDLVRVPWDGVAPQVEWDAPADGAIRHWVMVDADDRELASHPMSIDAHAGWTYRSNINIMLKDGAHLSVALGTAQWNRPSGQVKPSVSLLGTTKPSVREWTFETDPRVRAAHIDPSIDYLGLDKFNISRKPGETDEHLRRRMNLLLGRGGGGGSLNDIEQTAYLILPVRQARATESHGVVRLEVLRVDLALADQVYAREGGYKRSLLVRDVRDEVEQQLPMGCGPLNVVINTPDVRLKRAAEVMRVHLRCHAYGKYKPIGETEFDRELLQLGYLELQHRGASIHEALSLQVEREDGRRSYRVSLLDAEGSTLRHYVRIA